MEVQNKQKIDYATEAGNFVIHFSKKNVPILVEVLEASNFIKRSNKEVFHSSPILAHAMV